MWLMCLTVVPLNPRSVISFDISAHRTPLTHLLHFQSSWTSWTKRVSQCTRIVKTNVHIYVYTNWYTTIHICPQIYICICICVCIYTVTLELGTQLRCFTTGPTFSNWTTCYLPSITLSRKPSDSLQTSWLESPRFGIHPKSKSHNNRDVLLRVHTPILSSFGFEFSNMPSKVRHFELSLRNQEADKCVRTCAYTVWVLRLGPFMMCTKGRSTSRDDTCLFAKIREVRIFQTITESYSVFDCRFMWHTMWEYGQETFSSQEERITDGLLLRFRP
jgi:hypothetical protein